MQICKFSPLGVKHAKSQGFTLRMGHTFPNISKRFQIVNASKKNFHFENFNSEGRKFADLQIGGVFRDFNNEGLILEFFHLIISYPKISRENQFWHYRALKNNRKVLMSRFDEGPSFDERPFFLD